MRNTRTIAPILCLIGALALSAAPASAQKVYVDYDREADFETYETFQWFITEDTSHGSDIVHARIVNSVEYELTQGGLIEVEEEPDLYVTYHTEEDTEWELNTSVFGYGFGPSFYWDPFWSWGGVYVTNQVYTYTKGSLIVDIWDPSSKTLVWRGTMPDAIPPNALKAAKKIDRAVEKIAREWKKMYARDQKEKSQAS